MAKRSVEPFGADDRVVPVVLLVRLELGDEEEEGAVMLLPEEAFGAVRDEVDPILVFEGDGLAVVVVDGAVVWVGGVFERVSAFPQAVESATVGRA